MLIASLLAMLVCVYLTRMLGVSSVLGYIMAGWVLHTLGYKPDLLVESIAGTGVTILLFVIGLQMQLSRIWALRRSLLTMGGVSLLSGALVFGALIWLVGRLPLTIAVFIGLAVALSSNAFVSEMLDEKRQRATLHGRAAYEILLFQNVIAVVLLLSTRGANFSYWMIILIVLLLLLGPKLYGYVVLTISRAKLPELLTLAALLIAIGTPVLFAEVGLSGELGAFLAGTLLGSSSYRHTLEEVLEPFKGLFLGVFYLSFGLFGLPSLDMLPLLGLVVIVVLVKFAIPFVLARARGFSTETGLRLAALLAPCGEFTFISFALFVNSGTIDQAFLLFPTGTLVLGVVVFRMVNKYIDSSALRPVDDKYHEIRGRNLRLFVSYSRSNAKQAEEILGILEPEGFDAVIDIRDIPFGEKWRMEIAEHIRQCDAVLFLVSESAVNSEWCQWELKRATEYGKRLIPVVVQEVQHSELPDEVAEVQLFPRSGVFHFDDPSHASLMKETLQRDSAWLKEHTRLSERARLWDSANRNSDWLIRGKELDLARKWVEDVPANTPKLDAVLLDFIHSSGVVNSSGRT